jgi:protein translocase SecG subunit
MLYTLLLITYLIIGALLLMIISIQKSKGSIGIGRISGGTTMLFGGSGGQDIFQKTTWVLGLLFMGITLILSMMKSSESKKLMITGRPVPVAAMPLTAQPEQK